MTLRELIETLQEIELTAGPDAPVITGGTDYPSEINFVQFVLNSKPYFPQGSVAISNKT